MRFGLFLAMVAAAAPWTGLFEEWPPPTAAANPAPFDPTHVRAVVVERDENDPRVLQAVRLLGANTLVTRANPDQVTASAARMAGLFYIARMSTADVGRAGSDPAYATELQAVEPLAGVYYADDQAEEGYARPDAQESAYRSLKALLPDALILYPTRLTAVFSDPAFLDGYFRPQYTDLVTPYFYPVGPTTVGTFGEDDDWQTLLESLLRAVAERMPPGQRVLPVLQGFERIGFPADARLPLLQMRVYQHVWPAESSAAVFAWTTATPEPLVPLAEHQALERGVCALFSSLSPRPVRCRWAPTVSRPTLP